MVITAQFPDIADFIVEVNAAAADAMEESARRIGEIFKENFENVAGGDWNSSPTAIVKVVGVSGNANFGSEITWGEAGGKASKLSIGGFVGVFPVSGALEPVSVSQPNPNGTADKFPSVAGSSSWGTRLAFNDVVPRNFDQGNVAYFLANQAGEPARIIAEEINKRFK